MWGGAADNERAYVGLSDGSVTAITLATGERAWSIRVAAVGGCAGWLPAWRASRIDPAAALRES